MLLSTYDSRHLMLINAWGSLPAVFFFLGGEEISPNFDLKNKISTYTKDFSKKK
jgi:hypothetical protein